MRKIVLSAVLVTVLLAPTLVFAQWGAGGRRTVRCESEGNRYAYCRTYTTGRIVLRRQLSNAACREYETWGSEGDGSGVWVRNGCRAEFAVRERHWGWGAAGGGNANSGEGTFTCRSRHYSYNHCPVPGGRGRRIRLERQLSDASCVRGSSWGEDRYGIWVNNGCEGEFRVRR